MRPANPGYTVAEWYFVYIAALKFFAPYWRSFHRVVYLRRVW